MAWENFGKDWVIDAAEQLKLNPTIMVTPYGMLPKLSEVDTQTNDVVFTWNGTAAGVRVPNGDWIDSNRQGLTICDATSAAFAQALDWSKLDVVTYSWQKVLGGEAAHGMLLLGPRAVERLESYQPAWPMPKLFRMTENGVLTEGLFQGETINTPSMLAVEDYIDALNWVRSNGGLATMQARSNDSLKHIEEWAERTTWVDFLAVDPLSRSNTGVCLRIADPRVANLPLQDQARVTQAIASLLDKEGVAYDIASYKTAPPGLRIWCGGTVDPTDVKALTPWLDWAFETVMAQH
jgi:phosphoserine aminotransferase